MYSRTNRGVPTGVLSLSAETLVLNGTASDNGAAGGTLNQPVNDRRIRLSGFRPENTIVLGFVREQM